MQIMPHVACWTRPLTSRTSFYSVHVECHICLFFHSKESSCIKCFLEEIIGIKSKWIWPFRNHIIFQLNPSFHRKNRSVGRVILTTVWQSKLLTSYYSILPFNFFNMLPFNLFELIVTLLRRPYAKTIGNLKLEYEITSGEICIKCETI